MTSRYKDTITLPKTDFPMKANLPQTEPLFLSRWEEKGIYEQVLQKNQGRPLFVLHDGPPYANGHIHLGTAMNKTLKDMVVKSKNMSGFLAPYVPGWDCHGLPIEHSVSQKLGSKAKTMDRVELRKACRAYAERFIEIQRQEFRRLGVFGDWSRPYLTMSPQYQGQIAREFARVVESGAVYRKRRAIHWCFTCETALAEAEIEYADHRSPSVYVAYPLSEATETLGVPKGTPAFALIWTTTPWTLPASMAIAYLPSADYVWVEIADRKGHYAMAKSLVPVVADALGLGKNLKIVREIGTGEKFSGWIAKHPFVDRSVPFLPGEHVTTDSGTGLVHTAPGHGEEDYHLGQIHGLDTYSPVNAEGRFDSSAGSFSGMRVFEANPKIVELLRTSGRLFGDRAVEIQHSYPHCWRCKNPVIFRATEQWFLSMESHGLRQKALSEVDRVRWFPDWGRDRIRSMVEARPDWCLSRQRAWGVPIPSFICKGCGEHFLSAAVAHKVADIFGREGADAWFAHDVAMFLPPGTKCEKCGESEFEKGKDILDVWFDSGSSHAAVLEATANHRWPADLYLEGSDQHRGWFQSSLLEAVCTRNRAPYESVLTHGFVVDGEGKKMSKSLGNVINAEDVIKERGAELLRFWAATEDYRNDVRVSKEILERVSETYRRIRNTARYCLGNLTDFEPDRDAVAYEKLARDIDRWLYDNLRSLSQRVSAAYERYEFHVVVSAINEFCVVDLSSLYLDVSKDLLYCDPSGGPRRRSAQTVLFECARSMALYLAPILPITSEQIWDYLPAYSGKAQSVHLGDFPKSSGAPNVKLREDWEALLKVRGEVSKALEILRKEKAIGQSLEAEVELNVPKNYETVLRENEKILRELFIVSRFRLTDKASEGFRSFPSQEIPGLNIWARKVTGERCDRCWTYAEDVGKDSEHPLLCGRCLEVIRK